MPPLPCSITPKSKGVTSVNPPQPRSGSAATTRQQRELESRANRIANDHARQVREYLRFRKLGLGRAAAASEVGRATGTLDKWLVRYKAGGVAALRPNLSAPIGRPALPGLETFVPAVISELQRLSVDLGSMNQAARIYRTNKFCPTALANYIRKRGHLPQRLAQLVGFKRRTVRLRLAGTYTLIEELRRALQPVAA